jgi:hypothetical protein
VATKKPETKTQEDIQKALRARGAYVVKIHGSVFQTAALDLMVCYRGRFVNLEAKQPGEAATPRQAKIIRDVARAGGRSSVVFSVEDAMRVLDDIDEEMEGWEMFRCLTPSEARRVSLVVRSVTDSELERLIVLATGPRPSGTGGRSI